MYIRLWEKFKAWRRNETMLPDVNRGRCFVSNRPEKRALTGPIKVAAKSSAELVGIRIIRANGDIEEIL